MSLYLYELGTRPWEAKTEEERKRIERYEALITAVFAGVSAQEALRKLRSNSAGQMGQMG